MLGDRSEPTVNTFVKTRFARASATGNAQRGDRATRGGENREIAACEEVNSVHSVLGGVRSLETLESRLNYTPKYMRYK